ncbi:MAG: OadG family transporter subunit [Spirochaetes bacterium]|nr:OadG family transporter subunit [Spirochaetota bacterium]
MLEKGLFLMVIGMGVTFIFLGILIYAVKGASLLIWKFFPEPEEHVDTARTSSVDTEIAIAVAAVTARTHK